MSPHIARVVLFVLSGRCDLEWRLLVVQNVRIRISSSQCNIATSLRGSHSVTSLPPDRGDIPATTTAEAGTQFSNPRDAGLS